MVVRYTNVWIHLRILYVRSWYIYFFILDSRNEFRRRTTVFNSLNLIILRIGFSITLVTTFVAIRTNRTMWETFTSILLYARRSKFASHEINTNLYVCDKLTTAMTLKRCFVTCISILDPLHCYGIRHNQPIILQSLMQTRVNIFKRSWACLFPRGIRDFENANSIVCSTKHTLCC